MDQRMINMAEWENERNWSSPPWLGVYSSRIDSRILVPKRISGMGWTLNVGRPAGVFLLVVAVVGIPLLFILAAVLGGS